MLIFIALAASGFTLIPHGHCRMRIPIRARSSAPALADPAPYEEWLPAPAGESASTTMQVLATGLLLQSSQARPRLGVRPDSQVRMQPIWRRRR